MSGKSNSRHILKIPCRSAEVVEQGIRQLQGIYGASFNPPPNLIPTSCSELREIYGASFNAALHSVTSGNVREFASLPQTLPETPIYYAHPTSVI